MNGKNPGRKNRSGYTYNNKAALLKSGTAFFDELEKIINEARHEIHFQVYIFSDDETGRQIARALVRAAKRGVKIFMLLDAFGSNKLSQRFLKQFENENFRFRWFGRLFSSGKFHIGRRLHRKVIVVDGHTSVVSGINISDRYNDFHGQPAWLDFGVIIRGDISEKLHFICKKSWYRIRFPSISQKLKNEPEQGSVTTVKGKKIRVRENDWNIGKNQAAKSYYKMIRQARESITIVGGYFLPGIKARRLLRKASERGVIIRLIVAERSDVGVMHNAILYLYDLLLRNKIRVFEYQRSNVHGKVIVADKKIVSMGSYDLNTLSTYSNIELNVDIEDNSFAENFHDVLEEIIQKDCKEVTEDLLKKRSIRRRFRQWLSYRMVKSLFVLSIWLSRKERENVYQ